MITIYNKDKSEWGKVLVGQGCMRRYNLMADDYIKLKFSREDNVPLLIGDYVDLSEYFESSVVFADDEQAAERWNAKDNTTKLFVVDRNYYPKHNKSTGGWDYDVQINAHYKLWNNYILKYDQSGTTEAAFKLTDYISNHASRIVANLETLGFKYGEDSFIVSFDEDLANKGMKYIEYNAVTIYGALDLIASTFECEWWVVGRTIHFGIRRNEGDVISLTLDEEIADASTTQSDGVYATRLYAFGGTTNVPKNYREKLEFKVKSKGSDYIFADKAVYPNMFLNRTDAPVVNQSVAESSQSSSTEAIRSTQRRLSASFELGNINLTSQPYECVLSKVNPTVLFRKLLVRGDRDKKFSIEFEYGLRLVENRTGGIPSTIELIKTNKTLTRTVNSLFYTDKPRDISYDAVFSGRIEFDKDKELGTVVRNGALGPIELYKSALLVGSVISATAKVGNIYSEVSPFWRQGEGYDLEKNTLEFKPLVPVGSYYPDTEYTLFMDEYPTKEAFAIVRAKDSSGSVVRDLLSNTCYLSDDNKVNANFTPKSEGSYKIKFYINVLNAENVAWIDNEQDYMMLIDYKLPAFEMTLSKPDAHSAATKISFAGANGALTKDVIINPDHRNYNEANAAKIKFVDGSPLNVDTKFQFPEILRSRVPSEYYTDRAAGVTNAVVQKNIMLPEGTPFVGEKEGNVVEAIRVYDWIYPKTDNKVIATSPVDVKDDEGNVVGKTYNITIDVDGYDNEQWRVDENLYAIFQTGDLMGFRFELEYIKMDNNKPIFQLVPNEEYGAILPNEFKKPSKDDTLIIEGIDIQYFDTNAVKEAEDAVLAQAEKDLVSMSKENKVVDITLKTDDAYNRGRIALGANVKLGNILDDDYESRVIGFEEKLDIPYDAPKYIIGESNYYSRVASVESKLESITKASSTIVTGVSGNNDGSIAIIKRNEDTTPTDDKVYSALRVEDDFLHTKQDDSVNGNIDFGKNINVRGTANAKDLVVENNSTVGRQTVLGTQTLHDGFITPSYSNVGGTINGAQLTANGILSVAGIKATSLEIYELILNKVRAQGGEYVFSPAGTIDECAYEIGGNRVYPDEYNGKDVISNVYLTIKKDEVNTSCPFVIGDILYGNINDIGGGRFGQCVMHVVGINGDVAQAQLYPVGKAYDEYGNALDGAVASNIPPISGMTIAQRGNKNANSGRNTAFFISTASANIYMLSNITKPNIDKSNYATVIGQCPSALYAKLKSKFAALQPTDPINYAKYAFFENFIQLDHLGNPIQRENNRGEWSASIATSNPYINDAQYYDTVTYQGSLYKCLKSNTTQVPSEGGDWLLLVAKGKDGLSPNPNLLLNTNFESYDDNGILHWDTANGTISPSSLHNGYKYIQSSGAWTVLSTNTFGLDANGVYTLSLDYKTDSASDWNYPLQITSASRQSLQVISSSDDYIGSESGSLISAFKGTNGEWRRVYITFKIASSTQTSIPLNFCNDDSYRDSTKSLYISQIKLEQGYNATPYRVSDEDLKGADGVDRVVANLFDNANFEKTVTEGSSTRLESWGAYVTNSYPVTGKAFEGYNSYRVGESESFILAQEINLGAKEYTISFCLNQSSNKKGWIGVKAESGAISVFEPKNSTSHTLDSTSTELYDKRYFISTERVSSYEYFTFRLGLSKGSSVTILFGGGSLSYYVYVCQPQIQEGSKATSFTKSQLELAGPAGEAGPAAYPMGEWNSSTTYKKTYNTVPFVYYAKDSKYYVLNADSAKGSSQSPEYTEYWSVFTQFEQLYVKFLMANWALFGGDNGGVFYNGMLFSQDGVTHFGESSKFGSHMSGDYPMFDNKGKLTGNFVPNLFFNFADGAIKAGRFSEPFSKAEKKNNYYAIDPYKNHNVFIDMTVNSKYNKDRYDYALDEYSFQFRNDLILLPEYDSEWAEDGQHFSITTNAVNGDDTGLSNYGNSFLYDSCYNIYNLLAVDECMVSTESSYNDVTSASYSGNWIIWKGLRAKFMLLTPNTMLRLRLQIIKIGEEKVNFWHVENSEDFEAIKARLYVTKDSLSETEKIENEPTNKAFSMGFNTSNAAPHINLVTGFDADTTVYKPIILAPAGKFSVAYSDLERQGIIDNNSEKTFDILYSIGNALNNTYSHSVKTMRPSEFKF